MKGPTNSSARPNIRLLNVSAEFVANTDTDTNTEFPYRASIQADGVNEYMSATVMFSQVQAISGNFATFCQTDTDVIYIYSKTDVGTITIPAISCDLSVNYINVDNVPTEDSQAVITSGGVYDALGDYVDKTSAQNITGVKSFIDQRTVFKRTDVDVSVAPSTLTFMNGMQFTDKNGAESGAIFRQYNTDGSAQLILLTSSKMSGSTQEARLNINIAGNGTTKYVEAPYRTFNTLNTGDVVTIGHLAGTSITPTGSTYFTYNSTYSSVTRSGNVVVASFGGCSATNTSDQTKDALTGLPKAKYTTYGVIFSHYQGYLGWFRIQAGSTTIQITTTKADGSAGITCQFVYICTD